MRYDAFFFNLFPDVGVDTVGLSAEGCSLLDLPLRALRCIPGPEEVVIVGVGVGMG